MSEHQDTPLLPDFPSAPISDPLTPNETSEKNPPAPSLQKPANTDAQLGAPLPSNHVGSHVIAPLTPTKPSTPPNPLAKFPSRIKAKHKLFLETGNLDALDEVVLAVILDHQPSIARKPDVQAIPDSSKLIEDLGFDSLALAEIVFFFEDLYKVTITNEELKQISTMGEIRNFVRTKVAQSSQK